MLVALLRSAKLADLSRFLSPWVVSLFPFSELLRVVRGLSKNLTDEARTSTREFVRQHQGNDLELVLAKPSISENFASQTAETKRLMGSAILHLYFSQLMHRDCATLDFRPGAFALEDSKIFWNPTQFEHCWNPKFLAGVRKLYRGFYENNDTLFREALSELDLLEAETALRAHFGAKDGDGLKPMIFRSHEFVASFSNVFEACAKAKKTLPVDFVALGIGLGALYQSLERLNVHLDVTRAFREVAGASDAIRD